MSRVQNIGDLWHQRPDIKALVEGDGPIEQLFNLPDTLPADRVAIYRDLYAGVGHTRVKELALPDGGRVVLKQECTNPMGGSHYARYWVPYLFIAETLGVISPGETHLLEITSGNSGLTLAKAAKRLGYGATLLTPAMLPEKRLAPIRAEGAEVETVEGYVQECVWRLRRLLTTKKYFTPNHSEEASDLLVHVMRRISLEAIAAYPDIRTASSALGNGCSTVGLLRPFQQYRPNVQRRVYWPGEDFDTPVYGLYIQNVEFRHLPVALGMAEHVRIHGKLADLKKDVEGRIDLKGSDLGWSTYLGLHTILSNPFAAKGGDHFMVCYDSGDRY